MLIRTKLVGSASEVFAVQSEVVSGEYEEVKQAILSAYKLVPEAYRQQFRNVSKEPGQTYIKLERIKESNCDSYVRALKTEKTYEDLIGIILLEEFKNSRPEVIRTHVRLFIAVKEIAKDVKELQETAQSRHGLDSKIAPNPFKDFTRVDCVVTRSYSCKLKPEGKTKEKDEGVEVQLADTLFEKMIKEKPKQVDNQAEMFSTERLMELQQKDET
eukprot:g39789.t1